MSNRESQVCSKRWCGVVAGKAEKRGVIQAAALIQAYLLHLHSTTILGDDMDYVIFLLLDTTLSLKGYKYFA